MINEKALWKICKRFGENVHFRLCTVNGNGKTLFTRHICLQKGKLSGIHVLFNFKLISQKLQQSPFAPFLWNFISKKFNKLVEAFKVIVQVGAIHLNEIAFDLRPHRSDSCLNNWKYARDKGVCVKIDLSQLNIYTRWTFQQFRVFCEFWVA